MAYGATEQGTIASAEALVLRALAERIELSESGSIGIVISIATE